MNGDKAKIKRYDGLNFVEIYPLTKHDQIIASGSPGSTTFLRGDGVWATLTVASTLASGIVSTSAQTLAGEKTFQNGVRSGSGTQSWQIESQAGSNLLFRSGSTPVTRMTLSTGGVLTATTFSGSGASLTSLPASQLTGTVASARLTEGLLGSLETSFNIGRI
jgi:hypothetical protein